MAHQLRLVIEVDGPVHDHEEQQTFDQQRARAIEADGFLIVRVKENVVRDATEHVVDWITEIGMLILAGRPVPDQLRRMDAIPLP
ncbi:MAG: DUF559 domain-containing protein [Caulobacteraceae bacterium]